MFNNKYTKPFVSVKIYDPVYEEIKKDPKKPDPKADKNKPEQLNTEEDEEKNVTLDDLFLGKRILTSMALNYNKEQLY